MDPRGQNWIGGDFAEAASGAWFEPPAADGHGALGRWPRSADQDLDVALFAARECEARWRAVGLEAREELLRAAADRLLEAPDPDRLSQRALGFDDDELARHLRSLGDAVAEGLRPGGVLARGPIGAREGPCLLAPTWSSGWHAPVRAVLYALRAARPVIFAPDGRLPFLGDVLRAALAELPVGAFQVLYDDGRTVARAAVRRTDLPTAIVGAERLDADFAGAPHVEVARARRTTFVLDAELSLEDQVDRVVESSIGRARALSGSRSGQVGRLIATDRVFSRVGELVLERFEACSDAVRPLPIASRSQAPVLEAALALGLDEGATAILSGKSGASGLFPIVFTNVEASMRIARQATPCGMLLLLRAPDLRSAHASAARLDQEVRS